MSLQINNFQQQRMQNYLYVLPQQKQSQSKETTQGNPLLNGHIQMVSVNEPLKTMAKAISETKGDAAKVKEKSAVESAAGVAGQHVFSNAIVNKCKKLSNLTKVGTGAIIQTVIGVNYEEEADAFKDGAVSGKGGNFKDSYKKFFASFGNARDKAMKAGTWATIKEGVKQGLNFLPNLGSIALTNTAKYVGNWTSKLLGKDITTSVGSIVGFGGRLINTIGETVGNTVKGVFGAVKGIFKGNAVESLKETGKNFKKIGIAVKDKAVTLAKDVAKGAETFVKKTIKAVDTVKNRVTKVANKVKGIFKKWFG